MLLVLNRWFVMAFSFSSLYRTISLARFLRSRRTPPVSLSLSLSLLRMTSFIDLLLKAALVSYDFLGEIQCCRHRQKNRLALIWNFWNVINKAGICQFLCHSCDIIIRFLVSHSYALLVLMTQSRCYAPFIPRNL